MKFCVMFSPNQNPGAAPEHIQYNLVNVIVSHVHQTKFSKQTVQKLQCW